MTDVDDDLIVPSVIADEFVRDEIDEEQTGDLSKYLADNSAQQKQTTSDSNASDGMQMLVTLIDGILSRMKVNLTNISVGIEHHYHVDSNTTTTLSRYLQLRIGNVNYSSEPPSVEREGSTDAAQTTKPGQSVITIDGVVLQLFDKLGTSDAKDDYSGHFSDTIINVPFRFGVLTVQKGEKFRPGDATFSTDAVPVFGKKIRAVIEPLTVFFTPESAQFCFDLRSLLPAVMLPLVDWMSSRHEMHHHCQHSAKR